MLNNLFEPCSSTHSNTGTGQCFYYYGFSQVTKQYQQHRHRYLAKFLPVLCYGQVLPDQNLGVIAIIDLLGSSVGKQYKSL